MAEIKSPDDRHRGVRENVWFPFDEHGEMLRGMEAIKETNKSNFIRTAVRYLVKTIKENNNHEA